MCDLGYAYDAGMRVGDKLLAIDDFEIKPTTAVDEVRNHLRGEPGTPVAITFLREGVGKETNEPQTITLERSVVHIPDVKYFGKFTCLGISTIYSDEMLTQSFISRVHRRSERWNWIYRS